MSTSPAAGRRPYAARVPLETRREQLLDAALTIIVRDGYAAVTIDAVAREAGVTRPVVYGAYEGLGTLLSVLLDRQQRRATQQLLVALPASLDAADPAPAVGETVRNLLAMLADDPALWHPILVPDGMPTIARDRVEATRREVVLLVAGLIATVSSAGASRLDPHVAAEAAVAAIERIGRVVVLDPERFTAEQLVDTALTLLRALR